MYVLSTGCQWRYIPKDLPPCSTRWGYDGTLEKIHYVLYLKCRALCHPPTRSRSDPTVGQSGWPAAAEPPPALRWQLSGSHAPPFAPPLPRRGQIAPRCASRLQAAPPATRAAMYRAARCDAVLARHLCRRCARRQALRRNRLLLLNRPATPPLATRNQLNPWITSALTSARMSALSLSRQFGGERVQLHQ